MSKQEKYKAKQRLLSKKDAYRLAQKEKREKIKKRIEEKEEAEWQRARDVEAASKANLNTLEHAQSTAPTESKTDPTAEGNS